MTEICWLCVNLLQQWWLNVNLLQQWCWLSVLNALLSASKISGYNKAKCNVIILMLHNTAPMWYSDFQQTHWLRVQYSVLTLELTGLL